MFRAPKSRPWILFDKDIIDEAIYRTVDPRNRLIIELMARGGMRVGEVLGLAPKDIGNCKLLLHTPKSGHSQEVVFIPQKLYNRLMAYIQDIGVLSEQRIFPLSYAGARKVVITAGKKVGIKLRPHDLRRHAATYASRAGTPLEIVSKIILRHANLSTTQKYLGGVSDYEARKWIESLYG